MYTDSNALNIMVINHKESVDKDLEGDDLCLFTSYYFINRFGRQEN